MKLKYIIFVIVIVLSFYFFKKENNKRERIELEQIQKVTNLITSSVKKIVTKYNANDNWEGKLILEKSGRLAPVLTYELEELWISDQPILFTGFIKDISSLNDSNYVIKFERSIVLSEKYLLGTILQLELECSKQKVDYLIEKHPQITSYTNFVDGGVSVIGIINKIISSEREDSFNDKSELKIGVGKCLDLAFIGDVKF